MKCEECANYKAKEKQPRVTVLTFDQDGKQGSYSFRGKPDWARIERETIGQGMMAVIVKPACIGDKAHDDAAIIITIPELELWDGWYKEKLGLLMNTWRVSSEYLGPYPAHIKSAIAAWRAKQPKPEPEHYDGETCELPVWSVDASRAKGLRFEYTGKKEPKKEAAWGVLDDKISWGYNKDPVWILRAVPVEPPKPEWKAGLPKQWDNWSDMMKCQYMEVMDAAK